ncbi:MAG: hypothetical protein K2G63_06275 [Oscillospiraceae bacterium]|nr:hypothetical protein [Oscillospiraceae bacterium]
MKKEVKNISGIKINDSIKMSVKKKRRNFREFEALIIAYCGFAGIIMFFLSTFDIPFDQNSILISSIIFSVLYGIISTLKGKTALVFFPSSLLIFLAGILKYYEQIKTGFCLVFNIMYKRLTDTGINYFKSISPINSQYNVTLFMIFIIWLLAFIIFFFTVYRPNILIILASTFPVIEICLYYGIEVPILWTSLMIGYWLAVLSVCLTDIGEYYGGGGGFTRKDDTFFPKRKMKFKVTEKCGVLIILITLVTSFASQSIIDITGYERTDKIKEQRRELKTAINSFSLEDLTTSISDIIEPLGISLEYQDNRLGKYNKISYKGKTDLILTLDTLPENALYLKGFTASTYNNNEWFELDNDKYDSLNEMFEKYNIYPQQIPFFVNSKLYSTNTNKIKIASQKKSNKFYVPYGVMPEESFSFKNDNTIKRKKEKKYSFEFSMPDIYYISENLQLTGKNRIDLDYYHSFTDEQNQTIYDFCNEYENGRMMSNISSLPVLTDYDAMMNMLIENKYRDFVYENYLSYPDSEEFQEIYNEYSDILENASVSSAFERIDTLQQLKNKMNQNVSYTLEPGKTPSTRDFVNYFLLENKKGYCVHYATAGVLLARMAGIPARYATGYISVTDDYNEATRNIADSSYTVKIEDKRSHAWAEIYLDGYGWIPFEFTAGYSNNSIASENPESTETTAVTNVTSTTQTRTTTVSHINSGSSKNTKNSNTIVSRLNTTSLVSTTIITTISGNSSHSGKRFINMTDYSIYPEIFVMISILILIFVRRWIIITVRKRRLYSGNVNPKKRVLNNYKYVIKLFSYMNVKQENLQYNEFADNIEAMFADILFKNGNFNSFSEIVLKCSFSNYSPDKKELEFISAFSKETALKIYKKSGIIRKIYLKFFSALI